MADSTDEEFPVNFTEIRDAAFDYAKRGWRVVPLHGRDKRPYPQAWQKAATTDEEVLEGWWQRWSDANVGVALGVDSGVVDIECDDEEAEATLLKLFDGDFPVTPTYTASRGKHRLFKWDSRIPFPDKNGFKIGKLEFRTGNGGKGAQSAFPPSIHPSGVKYRWLISPDEASLATLPERVLAKLAAYSVEGETEGSLFDEKPKAKPQEHWDRVAKGVQEGGRNEASASFIGKLMTSLADPFDNGAVSLQWTLVSAWNQRNQPPLPERELKTTFDSILNRQRQKVAALRAEQIGTRQVDRDPRTGQQAESPWKLTLVLSNPRKWKLYSPWWQFKTASGYIELTSAELRNPRDIAEQAAEQAKHWIDAPSFAKFWLGDKKNPEPGMAETLMASADTEECAPEENREYVVAEKLLATIRRARKTPNPDPKGAPRILESDETIWFKHDHVLGEMQFGPEAPTGRELSKLLKAIGAEDLQRRVDGGSAPTRFKVLRKEAMAELERRATAGAKLYDHPVAEAV